MKVWEAQRDRRVGALIEDVFNGHAVPVSLSDANRGGGVFSAVWRVELVWKPSASGLDQPAPTSVVVKEPAGPGPNREAARRSGAYRRESLAYRRLLPRSPIRSPRAWHVEDHQDATSTFVLDDLSNLRFVTQADGMQLDDAVSVAEVLARHHRSWTSAEDLDTIDVRRSTASVLDADDLRTGLQLLDGRWGLDADQRSPFQQLVANLDRLVDDFTRAGPATLCHGDPRAANLAMTDDGEPVLFDWQQMAIQFGEADLAWLAATSLTVEDRRRHDRELVSAYGGDFDRYRLGFVLPGLAVLLLAQRDLDPGGEALVRRSLHRIGTAVSDLDVAGRRPGRPGATSRGGSPRG